MCSKSRNEDKDNIDQGIDVCAMGVQKSIQRKYSDVLTIALWSKWQLSKLFVNKR